MKKILALLTITLVLCSNAYAQTFTASTNRNKIPAGELFVLTLTYNGPLLNDEPKFSPIERAFTVYSAASSSSTQMINNSINITKQWQLSLISDKTSGNIEIPEIELGKLKSNKLTINIDNNATIENSSASQTDNRPQYSIKTAVDNNNPYIQQQIKYSIIIEDSGSLQISEPQFPDDIKNEWIIKTFGSPNIQNKTVDNKTVREITFNYVIFPQKSGTINLPMAKIDGFYITHKPTSQARNIAGNMFNNFLRDEFGDVVNIFSEAFAQRNPIIIKTEPSTIDVRPSSNIEGINWWLPAKNVRILSEWRTPKSQFMVGEAISRDIEVEAVGVIETQLPNINFPSIEGIKQYPEKPALSSSYQEDNIVSNASTTNVYIPSKAGIFRLPSIDIFWFNTTTNKVEKTSLAEEIIEILPNKNINIEESNIIPENSNISVKDVQKQDTKTQNNIEKINSKINEYAYMGLAFLVGIFLAYIVLKPKSSNNSHTIKSYKVDYKNNVIVSAKHQDFKTLRNSLINWATERFKDEKIFNLDDIKKHIKNKDFSNELDIITANLYSEETQDWDSQNFIKCFEKINHNRVITQDSSTILPKLYKE